MGYDSRESLLIPQPYDDGQYHHIAKPIVCSAIAREISHEVKLEGYN
jgi:hypothetical protein